ncbi:sulfhydryl oxidase 2-like [Daktulosphaira vitifoliae]|uniref:sulfhydryl oxidase 2-like n=1 Tax=Daktulosphaira vitifoliae TaxID=58002 RepID=UPI0021A9D884|nr:sulfhydryl oxidase 2-like [Daktulosphaira vitifoliae]XP_050519823.1 sulfhydryl oxidase 2-like [Daktulosphaira vitifoliae]XP_050519825.1 sulfhydryl oxidase 2-like [Daktulosphaira vitifoliae]XP_050519826.1 sulfhydryl oxidase 2-like [Daktulosphaira vitifoliae]
MILFTKMFLQNWIVFIVSILSFQIVQGAVIGLYDETDDLVILDSNNFNNTLINGNISYVIEFYNAYCGHCIRFASTWKEFGLEVSDWSSYVQIGAIDCSDSKNSQICRDYEVMAYPTVRYFPPHPKYGDIGIDFLRSIKTNEMKKALTKSLAESQKSGNITYLCDLQPFEKGTLLSDKQFLFTFVVVDVPENELANELIIDYCAMKEIKIISVLSTNDILIDQMKPKKYPSLYQLVNDNLIFLTSSSKKNEMVQHINQKLNNVLKFLPKYLDVSTKSNGLLPTREKILDHNIDVVYLSDLEATLSYSLTHEIVSRSIISGETLSALKNYLEILSKFFPSNSKSKGKKFIKMLWEKIIYKKEIKGDDLSENILSYESKLNPYTTQREWIGCRGSQHIYRKYPCGLWTLFHTLTVQAANMNLNEFSGVDILDGISGYVKHFFGCTECSEHFMQMTTTMHGNVSTFDDAVLWLWKAHNQVNKRLSGDVTEDPLFPKVQFPTREHCKKCHFDNSLEWNEKEVLFYLKNIYSDINMLRTSINNFPNEPPSNLWDSRPVHVVHNDFNVHEQDEWKVDINTCMLSYILSCSVLIVLFYMLVIKRHCRRKKSIF